MSGHQMNTVIFQSRSSHCIHQDPTLVSCHTLLCTFTFLLELCPCKLSKQQKKMAMSFQKIIVHEIP